jgi:hypothetical protein
MNFALGPRNGVENSNVTETSLRGIPGGSVIDFGNLDSLARVNVDSAHPVIAREETNIATVSAYLLAR